MPFRRVVMAFTTTTLVAAMAPTVEALLVGRV
jgi:hypothetical protein